jgi:hypothetical protein
LLDPRYPEVAMAARDIAWQVIPDGRQEEVLELYTFLRKTKLGGSSDAIKIRGAGGSAVKKLFSQWYNRQNCFTLTRTRKWEGFMHKDVIKLCHIKGQDIEHDVVFSYILNGMSKTEAKFDGNKEAETYVALLGKIQELRSIANKTILMKKKGKKKMRKRKASGARHRLFVSPNLTLIHR